MAIDWNHLSAPFAPEDVEWKPGATTRDKKKGLAMAYITARAVQERLDEVFTPGGWRNEFREGPSGGVICRIYFKTGETDANGAPEWAWREDGADNTDVEAVKGGLSNAMKRAGAALGVGRYLYKLPQQWVPLDDRGRFAQTPRIPREYLPASGRSASGGGRPSGNSASGASARPAPEARRQQTQGSRPEPSRPDPRQRPQAPQNSGRPQGGQSGAPGGRPQPREGQRKVIRRVGGQDRPGGDGASTRPPAAPRPF